MQAGVVGAILPQEKSGEVWKSLEKSREVKRQTSLDFVDCSATVRCAARTFGFVIVPRNDVIQREFFARRNVAQGIKVNASAHNFDEDIRVTRVIEVLRAVAADAAVNRPIRINRANVNACCALQPTFDFLPRDVFARIFCDFVAFAKGLRRITTLPVNR